MDTSVDASASSGASVNYDDFEETPDGELISLRSNNEPMEKHLSKSPLETKHSSRVNDKLDFLTNHFMAKCKISKNQN
jgi:hypothetical protein